VPAHHARRLRAQLLGGPAAPDAVAVTQQLLAVQAQDPRGFRLAMRARTRGLTARDVDRQLDERRLVVTWLNRGTLHLVTAEDYWFLQPLTTPQLRTGSTRRLREEGVDERQAARGVDVVARELSTGPRTRSQLRAALDAAGVPTARQALVHVLLAAALEGLLVRGPVIGREQAFVDPVRWLGPRPRDLDEDVALRMLVLRYLRGHGPAEPGDLARWAGITLGAARRGFAAAADATSTGAEGLADLAERVGARRPSLPPPRLLGPFDPLLLGWASRTDVTGAHTHLVTVNGLFRPFALVGGRAVATWSLERDGVDLQLLDTVSEAQRRALEAEARDIVRFLG